MTAGDPLHLGMPQCLAATGDQCGEGILWHPGMRCVFWTDINRFLVHRYNLASADLKTWFFSEPVTCVLPTIKPDTLVLVLGSGAILWEPAFDVRHAPFFRLPDWPRARCNEAAIGPQGDLWIGSMRNNVKEDGASCEAGGWDGALYRINSLGDFSVMRSEVGISNTILWSPDHSRFYFGDTLRNELWSYRYQAEESSIYEETSFFKGFERGWPDGSAIDSEGYLWNCRYGGGCIVRVAPDGKVDRVIEMPVGNPTNCTFGGTGGNILYVTSAAPESGRWERFKGCLLAIETNVRGLPPYEFRVAGNTPAELS